MTITKKKTGANIHEDILTVNNDHYAPKSNGLKQIIAIYIIQYKCLTSKAPEANLLKCHKFRQTHYNQDEKFALPFTLSF